MIISLTESSLQRILNVVRPLAFNFQIELDSGDAIQLLEILALKIIELGLVAEATELHTIAKHISRETGTEWFLDQNYPNLVNRKKW